MNLDRLVEASFTDADEEIEYSLRPRHLSEYIGQKAVSTNLEIFITAAKQRNEPLDHVLFYGPPGLGKTTLAGIIANEMNADLRIISGPAVGRAGDLLAVLTNLQENDVLFIDEIHRLNRSVEEILYSAMEDFVIDIIIGKGPSARTLKVDLPKFTLVGATTRAGSLSAPLRDRFGVICKFELYTVEELMQIIFRSARILGVEADEESVRQMAMRSRGTPRVANRVLKRVRDYSQVRSNGVINKEISQEAFDALGIDAYGLESLDREILKLIIERFKGGPVGIDTIAAAIGEERVTLEDVYEPYLIQQGFLYRTPKGRMVTDLAYKHFGIEIPSK